MCGRTTSRILISGMFLVSVMIGTDTMAQQPAPPQPTSGATTQKAPPSKAPDPIESNPACQRIIQECKRLGFVVGDWKQDNGLWANCFDPVVKGKGNATRDGKPIKVPVRESDLQACRAVVEAQNKQP